MNPVATFKTALWALSANKLRSSLTLLGIVIGVAAVISLMSIGRGAQQVITSRIASLGSNLLFVSPGAVATQGVRAEFGTASTLTLDDALAISDAVPSVLMVAPEVSSGAQLVAGGKNMRSRVTGVTPEYQFVRSFSVSEGEFITEEQLRSRSRVVVLGALVADSLFGLDSPVGQTVFINRLPFTVIGVLKSKGGTGLGSQDNVAMIPITTMLTRLASQRTVQGRNSVQLISVQAADKKDVPLVKEQVANLLRDRKNISEADNFVITTQQELEEAVTQTTSVFVIFLGAIAGISLLVGGIGIMNIMLVSVTERIREIGIRKAVGAKRKDILLQFLTEAILLSLGGGFLGLLAGWGLARLISGLQLGGQMIRTSVSLDIVLLAVMVSVAVGLFFGIYPAYRAASLNPIEALRYE